MFSCWEKSTVTAFVIVFTVDREEFGSGLEMSRALLWSMWQCSNVQ